ncbi:MAG: recombinase family protein, partial [Eubacteriales bacterium]
DDFNRMINDCRDGKIDRIVTKSTSRFSRNTLDSIATVRELKAIGVSVYFEKEGIDTDKLTGENLLTLYSLFAQEESESISRNVKKGKRIAMSKGEFVSSNAAYGYRLVEKELIIDEQEAEVVRRIFREYLQGRGTREIAKILTAENIPTKTGNKQWRKRVVSEILKNERYIGDMLFQKKYHEDTLPYKSRRNRGELPQYYTKNTHEAIVSRIEFEIVNILIRERASGVNGEYGIYLLSRKISCKECGTTFRRKLNNGKIYWVCRAHDEDLAQCGSIGILENDICQAFIRMYNKLQTHRKDIIEPIITALGKLQECEQRGNEELKNINKRIAELSEQNHRMTGLMSSGILDSALFISKSDELKKQLKEVRQAKSKMLSNMKRDTSLVETEDLLEILEECPPHITEMNEEIFSSIVEKILAQDNQTIDFVLKNGLVLTERL